MSSHTCLYKISNQCGTRTQVRKGDYRLPGYTTVPKFSGGTQGRPFVLQPDISNYVI